MIRCARWRSASSKSIQAKDDMPQLPGSGRRGGGGRRRPCDFDDGSRGNQYDQTPLCLRHLEIGAHLSAVVLEGIGPRIDIALPVDDHLRPSVRAEDDGVGNADGHLFSGIGHRSEEHTYELPSLMRISYAVFCLNKTTTHIRNPLH